MAANNDILGISGHLDISDISHSINEIINNLEKIGIKTDSLSKRVSDSMQEIARSTDDSATKQKRTMEVFAHATEEAKAALANYPEQIRLAKEAMQQTEVATSNLEKELTKLNTQLNSTVIGSEKYNELKASIQGVEQQIHNNTNAFQAQQSVVQEMEAGYNGLVSMLGVANTSTAANAVAHGAVTAATLVEAGAHANNAEKIEEETKAAVENKTVKELQADTAKKVFEAVENELSAYDNLADKIKEGAVSNGEYQRSLEGIRTRLAALNEERKNIGEKYDKEAEKLNTDDMINGELVSRGNVDVVNALAQQYNILEGQIGALEGTLKELEQTWNSTHQKASQNIDNLKQKIGDTKKAETELNQEASKEPTGFKAQWNAVNEMHSKIRSLTKELQYSEAEFDKIAEKPGFDPQSKKAQELTEKIASLKKEIADTKKEMSEENGVGGFLAKWKNSVVDAATGNGKFQASLGNMKNALGGLAAPFTAATSGAVAFTKALWAMAATPIGAVLSAIVLALQAMFMWFKKSAEGQRAFAKISAYVGSLLSSIMDIAIKVGGYLYHAFADPQGALNQFGRGLSGLVINPLKAVAKTLSGVGQIAKGVIDLIASGANVFEAQKAVSTMKKGWEDLKSAGTSVIDTLKSGWDVIAGGAKGAFSTIGEGISKGWMADLSSVGSEWLGKAKQAAQLAGQEIDAQKQLSEAKMKEHQLDIAIAEEREKIYTLTGKEKDAQIEKVKNMLKEKYKPQIAAQQTLLDIQRQRNKLHTVSLEQLAKEREAQGAVYQIQAQQAASTRMLVRMQQANLKSMANAAKKDANQQKKVDDADAAYNEVEYKNALARAKYQKDIEEQITDARIAAMKEGAAKVEAERNRQFQKELEKLDEQRQAAIQAERNRQKAEFDATEKKVEARGGKAQKWSEDKLDKSVIDKINAQYDNLRKLAVERQQNDIRKQQIQSEINFLKQYGSIEQQRLAITQEYEEKINEAIGVGDSYKAASLIQERDSKLKQNSAEELRQNINWDAIFQDITAYDVEFLNSLQTDLEDAIKDGIEKGIDAADLKVFADKLQEVKNTIIEKTGGLFSSQGLMGGSWLGNLNQAEQKRTQLETIATNKKEEADRLSKVAVAATEERMRAEIRYNDASTPQEREKTWLDLLAAQKKEKDAGEDSKKADKEAKGAQSALTSFTKQMPMMITDTIIHGVNDNLQSANKMITEWGIGSEDFQEKFAKFAESSQYATAAFESLKSGDVAGTIFNVGEAFNSLGESFGLWSNSNRAEIEEANEKLANATDINTRAIEKLTKVMEEGSIPDAVNAAERMKMMYDANQFNALQTMRNNASMYDGGSSLQYQWNEGNKGGAIWQELVGALSPYFTEKDRQLVSRVQGTLQDILELDPQTLAKLYEIPNGTEILNRLTQSITDAQDEKNYNGLATDLLNYIDQFGKDVQLEIDKQLAEKITGTSLESFRDSYKSILMDMRKDTDDFVDDITEKMQQALVADLVDNTFKDELKGIYNQWKDLVKGKSEGTLTDQQFKAQAAAIRAEQETYAKQMQEQRDYLAAVTGYNDLSDSEASGSINAAKSMSEDTGNELVGRATAVQIAVETLKAQNLAAAEQQRIILGQSLVELGYQTGYLANIDGMMQSMGTDVKSIREGIQQSLEAQGIANMHLAAISANTEVLPSMYTEIAEMRRKIDTL